jgi:hypothetical protein
MTTFEKKTVYHSQIIGRQLRVRVPGPPRDSKYQGQLPFVKLEVENDPTVYTLNLENDDVRGTFELAAGEGWHWMTAGGSDSSAWVTLEHQMPVPVKREVRPTDVARVPARAGPGMGAASIYLAASIAEIHVKTGIPLRAPVRHEDTH